MATVPDSPRKATSSVPKYFIFSTPATGSSSEKATTNQPLGYPTKGFFFDELRFAMD